MSLKDYPQHVLHEAGWYTRGYLPHFDGRTKPQAITLHLADSVPVKVIERWEKELRDLTDEHRLTIMRKRIDKYLDQGYGECYLRDQHIAKLVQDSLLKYDDLRCTKSQIPLALAAWRFKFALECARNLMR